MLVKVLGSFDELAAFCRRFGRFFGGSLDAKTFFGPRLDPPRVAPLALPVDKEARAEGRPRSSPSESTLGLSLVIVLAVTDEA
jgi:hypothetical protein